MEVAAAKLIGAGLAAIALAGAGVGIGTIFGNYLSAAIRNPSAAQKQFPNLLLGFALAEATGARGEAARRPEDHRHAKRPFEEAFLIIEPALAHHVAMVGGED